MTSKFYWHIHHEELIEATTDPISVRRAFIRQYKDSVEVPVRLRWMKPVKGKLPDLTAAYRAYRKAIAAESRARLGTSELIPAMEATDAAARAYGKALDSPEVKALHALEHPGCPWDGKTLFGPGWAASVLTQLVPCGTR